MPTQITRTAYIAGVATHISVQNGANVTSQVRYLHKDHLGSLDAMSDDTGAVIKRMSFDVWGKRRDTTWTPYAANDPGYTWQNEPMTRG